VTRYRCDLDEMSQKMTQESTWAMLAIAERLGALVVAVERLGPPAEHLECGCPGPGSPLHGAAFCVRHAAEQAEEDRS